MFTRLGDCEIHSTASICTGAIIGKPFRPLLDERWEETAGGRTVIGANSYVGYFAIVGAGSTLSEDVIIDDNCVIESDVMIGKKALVIYRSQICNEAQVGSRCVIGGFIAERVVVGDEARVFGKIIHTHGDPSAPWDAPESEEPSAVLEAGCFVGFNALVVGGVRIGRRAYVCAGAIVTSDVPAGHIAFGVNEVIPASKWTGSLGRSPFFHLGRDGQSYDA